MLMSDRNKNVLYDEYKTYILEVFKRFLLRCPSVTLIMINIYVSPKILAFLLSFLVSNSPQTLCVLWFSSMWSILRHLMLCVCGHHHEALNLNDQFASFFKKIILYLFIFTALDPPASLNEYLNRTVWLSYKQSSSTSNFNLIVLKRKFISQAWNYTTQLFVRLSHVRICRIHRRDHSFLWLNETRHFWTSLVLQGGGGGGWWRSKTESLETRTHIQSVFRFRQQKASWFSLGERCFQFVERSQVCSVGLFGWRRESLWFWWFFFCANSYRFHHYFTDCLDSELSYRQTWTLDTF